MFVFKVLRDYIELRWRILHVTGTNLIKYFICVWRTYQNYR